MDIYTIEKSKEILSDKNIFIFGSIASGKTELSINFKNIFGMKVIESELLFRVISFLILNDKQIKQTINLDLKKLQLKEQSEINKLTKVKNRYSYLVNKLNKIYFSDNSLKFNKLDITETDLYNDNIAIILQ